MTQPDPAPKNDPAPQPDPPKPDDQKPPAQETDWKAESRKHEERAKANFEKAKAYDELLESQKTEQQRQADALTAAQRQAEDNAAEALRYKVAVRTELTGAARDLFLEHARGDEAAMQSYAEGLMAIAATATPPPDPNAPRRPAPAPTQGQPPAPATSSIESGAAMYAQKHGKKASS